MINLTKWPKKSDVATLSISKLRADAVADVRTFNDELSIWSVNSDSESDINEAFLALATGSKQERFDKMDVVIFTNEDLASKGLTLQSATGDTAVVDLRDKHQNIVGLTYETLTSVMSIISEITYNSKQIRRTGSQIKQLIKDNYDRIDLDTFITDSIKVEIKKIAGK